MSYSAKVIDHYDHPKHVGTLDKNASNVGTAIVGAPSCGDVLKLQIEVGDDGVITNAKFKTFGCMSAIAASDVAAERLIGKHLDEATLIKNSDIADELSLPPVKIHCSVLAEDAIKSAVQDYRHKRQSGNENAAANA